MPLNGGVRTGGARPVVTLLTDFGTTEPFVGLVKAQVLRACPDAVLVDLTHELPPFSVEAGAFWIERCYGWFPPGTVHVCVVDPGVGTSRRVLLVEQAGQRLLAPDNGLLAGIASQPGAVVRVVEEAFLRASGLPPASATFHGRDLFAPVAGRLASGATMAGEVGPEVADFLRRDDPPVRATQGIIRGSLRFQDRFGNWFSNIEMKALNDWKDWQVLVGERVVPWVRTYGEAPAGCVVALENAFGVIEIARVEGSAADEPWLGAGVEIEVRRSR